MLYFWVRMRLRGYARGGVAVMGRAAFEVSAADEVAGFVVAVATFDEGPGWGLPWRASDGLGRCVFECAGCF